MTARRILVTSALPNANGSIHLGHLLEHIQTDIWVRYQRMCGHECIYVCADDTHGTAIMLKADDEGISPEELVARIKEEHEADFRDFGISHDNYHSTHSPENEAMSALIYRRLRDKDQIAVRVVDQLFDPERQLFLADRFIVGTCPRCKADGQYGDNCENCGATYDATDLIDPTSKISGATPVMKGSEHYFFALSNFQAFLETWTRSGALQDQVANKLAEWLDAGLKDWDISRDAPYFGFEIPDAPGKYFYVWLDAPIGYMASFQHLCDRTDGLEFDDFWAPGSTTEVHHFIGKDIINFHALFWPAMLDCAGFRTPTKVHAHGFITVDGQKMSKSRGTFINARTYLDHLDPSALRYYFGARLGGSVDDIDINLDDFVQRVNSDLVGKFVNIASRCAGFIVKQFDGELKMTNPEPLLAEMAAAAPALGELIEAGEFGRAVREVMAFADRANQYINDRQPWAMMKDEARRAEVQDVCSNGINMFRQLAIFLKPLIPELAARAEAFLGAGELGWRDGDTPLDGHRINTFQPLMTRIESKHVDAMIEAGRDAEPTAPTDDTTTATATVPDSAAEPIGATIDFEDFAKVDLRVAEIVAADHVEGADKLLKLTLSLGDEQRTVFAGIKSAYDPASLVGRHTVMVANLAARKMRFGMSEGMVLAAGPGGKEIFLLSPDAGATPGMVVK